MNAENKKPVFLIQRTLSFMPMKIPQFFRRPGADIGGLRLVRAYYV